MKKTRSFLHDSNQENLNMKKILGILLVMMIGVMGGVMAGTNTFICFASGGVVDFSVTPSLIFPSVTPGNPTSNISTIILGDTNNVNLTLNVYLETGSDSIFTNVVLTSQNSSVVITPSQTGPNLKIGSADPVVINVADIDVDLAYTVQNDDILATLSVPLGTIPSVRIGTIVYQIVGPEPINCS